MNNEIINNIKNIIDNLLKEDKYFNEYNLLNELIEKINYLANNKDKITLEYLDYIKEKFNYLEQNYNEIFDLTYYFDPIYIELKNNIHKREVSKIREKQKNKKEGLKNNCERRIQ